MAYNQQGIQKTAPPSPPQGLAQGAVQNAQGPQGVNTWTPGGNKPTAVPTQPTQPTTPPPAQPTPQPTQPATPTPVQQTRPQRSPEELARIQEMAKWRNPNLSLKPLDQLGGQGGVLASSLRNAVQPAATPTKADVQQNVIDKRGGYRDAAQSRVKDAVTGGQPPVIRASTGPALGQPDAATQLRNYFSQNAQPLTNALGNQADPRAMEASAQLNAAAPGALSNLIGQGNAGSALQNYFYNNTDATGQTQIRGAMGASPQDQLRGYFAQNADDAGRQRINQFAQQQDMLQRMRGV